MNVSIRPATERDRALIRNIFNLYQNELSEYSHEFTHLDENGYFAPDTVNEILPFGDGVFPYIVTDGGKNVGFVMVTDSRYALPGCDWRFEEFFLIKPARGKGAALKAAKLAMENRPGRWCLSVFTENARAKAFWKKLIADLGAEYAEAPGVSGMTDLCFTAPSLR